MKNKRMEPIKSKEEADKVREWLIGQTMKVGKVDREEAGKRMDALFESGELDGYHYTNPMFQLIVDKYMLNQHKTNGN